MGYFAGDGCYHLDTQGPYVYGRADLYGQEADRARVEEVLKLLRVHTTVVKVHTSSVWRRAVSRKDMWWVEPELQGSSHTKRVPMEALSRLGEEAERGFVEGLWDSDGSVGIYGTNSGSQGKHLRFSSVSQDLVNDLRCLLGKFGVESVCRFSTRKDGKKDCTLRVNRPFHKQFKELFTLQDKKQRILENF
jgi:intein-encoded DNA endonuclease-like protein